MYTSIFMWMIHALAGRLEVRAAEGRLRQRRGGERHQLALLVLRHDEQIHLCS